MQLAPHQSCTEGHVLHEGESRRRATSLIFSSASLSFASIHSIFWVSFSGIRNSCWISLERFSSCLAGNLVVALRHSSALESQRAVPPWWLHEVLLEHFSRAWTLSFILALTQYWDCKPSAISSLLTVPASVLLLVSLGSRVPYGRTSWRCRVA